jgi:hypothetical protein
MSDDNSQSNDHKEVLPPVCANIVFDLTDPEGERRLRECIDAPKIKLVLWNIVYGDSGIFENIEYAEDHFEDDYADGQLGALRWVLQRIGQLCDEYNVDLED